MPKVRLIGGFKDPLTRPRYIIWTGAVVLLLAAFVVTALGVTSTYWFCAEVCHKVQDDSIIAYDRSAHSEVSCMACHVPVGITPIGFVLKKAEALGELYLTATNKFHLPLNPDSHLALSRKYFPEKQCNQCHNLELRPVTPSPGIIIDHAVHSENDIQCTACHNRTAHVEDFDLTLTDPNTGEPNQKHDDFMLMTACFRCHTLTEDSPSGIWAPGACEACHTPGFELMPDNHRVEGFYELFGESSGHAEMAREEYERAGEAFTEWQAHVGDLTDYDLPVVPVAAVNYCSTCHVEREFCDGCHGIEMPHPAGFAEAHGDDGRARPEVCETCHATAEGVDFCNACHHPQGDPTRDWIPQHMGAVRESGAQACFDCHAPTYCAECHVRGGS